MRQTLLRKGANELSYEIRGIVKKAEQLEALGHTIYWENIGDPIQKHNTIPLWMKEALSQLMMEDETYGYSHSKGDLHARSFLADMTNQRGGAQITANDITFFNGLGDAIAKVYQYLLPSARVIGPSPAYSTHSSAEAAHADHKPITYQLDPDNSWYPDVEDLYYKVKYNPSIVGLLIINPDNPTGMVYPKAILEKMVAIAKEFNLFIICDEIYSNVIYNGAETCTLSEIIEDVPAMSLRGISKEYPWPGARCGWAEYYNRDKDADFNHLCETIDSAKMIEVSATKLPQRSIPIIMSDPRYKELLKENQAKIGGRSRYLDEVLRDVPYITFNKTNGAFYNTIIFNKDVLNRRQSLKIKEPEVQALAKEWLSDENMDLDKRFVYYLLASRKVCTVPISSFCSELMGFRVTLLEEDETVMRHTFQQLKEGIIEFCESA